MEVDKEKSPQQVYDPDMFRDLIGRGLGPRSMEYNWRDVVLYALGVGAGKYDLPYIFEKDPGGLKVLPTFGLLPYLNSVTMVPVRKSPYAPNEIVGEYITEKLGYLQNRLHMAMDLTIHREIPSQGTFLTEDKVNNVLDRGEGKGVVADCQMDIYDRAGNNLCTLHSYHYHSAFGGFGGPKFETVKQPFPDRPADIEVTEFMRDDLAVLYRLTGDTNDVHIDPAFAESFGYEKPFMQGLCTFGFTTRMLIQAVIPFQPERVTHVYAQMRSVCYPGQDMKVSAWKIGEGKLIFKLEDSKGRLILGNGMLEYKA